MTFDPNGHKTTTRQQWEDYAGAETVSRVIDAPVRLPSASECVRIERESFGALHQILGSMTATDQDSVWTEIESALSQFETDDGFVGPCELVVAGATR
jgi:hypothetical protein